MLRQWKERTLELLAPAGTFDIYREVINSACDAVYCGGSNFNMRMIRKGYNFTEEELKEAVGLAREKGKKIYITVNSLLDQTELSRAEDYLGFLQEIAPHGLIIQDTALLKIMNEKGIRLPLHSSVMMNVHNLDMIRQFQEWGISRVVLSREMPLDQVRQIALQSDMELEYFVHGDMCAVHGSQCLYSSYLFGMSSNRGRCLKPCRWPMNSSSQTQEKPFPLAVKDLSLYSHFEDMILAGISSFKIEGRMRSKDFIIPLINRYGEALDRFLDDPLGHDKADMEDMEPFKKRDYSNAYAFGKPGMDNINSRGEGTGEFYSTGKMFSLPTIEKTPDPKEWEKDTMGKDTKGNTPPPRLSLRVNTVEQARHVLSCHPDRLYLSLEPFAPHQAPSKRDIEKLSRLCAAEKCELFLALPRMTSEKQNSLFHVYLKEELPIDGLLLSHAGMLQWPSRKDWMIHADASLNLYNAASAAFLQDQGVTGWTPSLEIPFDSLLKLPAALETEGAGKMEPEVILHGLPTVMYMDHDVSGSRQDETILDTGKSSLTVKRDCWDRYHILPDKELCLLPRLPALLQAGYRRFRLELQAYEDTEMIPLIQELRTALEDPSQAVETFLKLQSKQGGYSYGAQGF